MIKIALISNQNVWLQSYENVEIHWIHTKHEIAYIETTI